MTDLDEEEIKKRMELLEEGDEEGEGSSDDEGLVAPKGLDQAADKEESNRKEKKQKNDKNEESDEEDDE